MQSIIVEKEVQNQFAVVALSVVSDPLTQMASEGDFLDLPLVGCTLLIIGVPRVFWVVYVFINELAVVLYFR